MNWKTAYLETRVMSASPLELVSILYEYATLSVQDARSHLVSGDIPGRARSISKTIAILGELESSLNYELGGDVTRNLARLYHYMRDRLTHANLTQTDEPLAETQALLKTLGDGWQQISKDTVSARGSHANAEKAAGWGGPPPVESMTGHMSQSWSA